MNAEQAVTERTRIEQLDFEPPRLLRSAHLQSVLASTRLREGAVRRRAAALRSASRPRIVTTPDGTRLEALVSRHGDGPRPVVIALHGWHGCGESLHVLAPMAALFDDGFDVVRLHLRDHGGTEALNDALFHSCRIDETLAAVTGVRSWFEDVPAALVGFSLGGNFALRIARRAGEVAPRLARVIAVNPVLDPGRTMAVLDAGWFGYRFHFMRNWRGHLRAKAAAWPERYDFGETRALKDLTTMTDWFVARHTPYGDTASYLADYTLTGDALASVGVPTRIITAADDPMIPADDFAELPASASLSVGMTPYGGHCGYVANARLEDWLGGQLLRELGELRVAQRSGPA